MFTHYTKTMQDAVTLSFEGKSYTVPAGISVAAAVLGHAHTRHTSINAVTGEHRGPYCLMGVCFECMVEIDDQPNQQACLVTVREGMQIRRQTELVELD